MQLPPYMSGTANRCLRVLKTPLGCTVLWRTLGLFQAVPYVCVPQLQDTLGLSQAVHTCPVLPINRCLLVRVLRIPLGCTVLWRTLWDYPRLSCTILYRTLGHWDYPRLSHMCLYHMYRTSGHLETIPGRPTDSIP